MLGALFGSAPELVEEKLMKIAKGKVVAVDYELTDPDGTVLDTSHDDGPLSYLHGVGGLLPALEGELEGKTAGDSFSVVLAPEDGYGVRDESLRQQLPRTEFDDVPDLAVGMQFRVSGDASLPVFTIVEVGDDTVTIDGNHPLADVTLHFDLTVRDVRDATEEEIAHGHAHGECGHGHEHGECGHGECGYDHEHDECGHGECGHDHGD